MVSVVIFQTKMIIKCQVETILQDLKTFASNGRAWVDAAKYDFVKDSLRSLFKEDISTAIVIESAFRDLLRVAEKNKDFRLEDVIFSILSILRIKLRHNCEDSIDLKYWIQYAIVKIQHPSTPSYLVCSCLDFLSSYWINLTLMDVKMQYRETLETFILSNVFISSETVFLSISNLLPKLIAHENISKNSFTDLLFNSLTTHVHHDDGTIRKRVMKTLISIADIDCIRERIKIVLVDVQIMVQKVDDFPDKILLNSIVEFLSKCFHKDFISPRDLQALFETISNPFVLISIINNCFEEVKKWELLEYVVCGLYRNMIPSSNVIYHHILSICKIEKLVLVRLFSLFEHYCFTLVGLNVIFDNLINQNEKLEIIIDICYFLKIVYKCRFVYLDPYSHIEDFISRRNSVLSLNPSFMEKYLKLCADLISSTDSNRCNNDIQLLSELFINGDWIQREIFISFLCELISKREDIDLSWLSKFVEKCKNDECVYVQAQSLKLLELLLRHYQLCSDRRIELGTYILNSCFSYDRLVQTKAVTTFFNLEKHLNEFWCANICEVLDMYYNHCDMSGKLNTAKFLMSCENFSVLNEDLVLRIVKDLLQTSDVEIRRILQQIYEKFSYCLINEKEMFNSIRVQSEEETNWNAYLKVRPLLVHKSFGHVCDDIEIEEGCCHLECE